MPARATSPPRSDVYATTPAVVGRVEPRLFTPPLVELGPNTSYGYRVIAFADEVLGTPLDPWECNAVIRLGELLPDGRPRFREILIIVARQNGKTLLAKVLILYWLFVESQALVLGTSTDRKYAKRTWSQICKTAKANPWLAEQLGKGAVRLTIGEEALVTQDEAEYLFAANNSSAGRSTTLNRWVCDELRVHDSWNAWSAATNAMNAVPDAQVVAITNMGDDSSIVLDSLRGAALEFIETGVGNPRLGILEWSAPPGSDPTDLEALAYANPNLGHRVDADALVGTAMRVKRAGGIELAEYRTEVMCQRVHHMDAAIDPDLWAARKTDEPLDLAEHRQRVVLALDVSLDGSHASLIAAAQVDGVVHLDVVKAWDGFGCTRQVRGDLPGLVAAVRPRMVVWYPAGPASVLTADLTARPREDWPPRRVTLEEIRSDVPATCMSLADLVATGALLHSGDPLLDQHIENAAKLKRGDQWVFGRRGAGPVDAAYAAAGAAFAARMLPPAPPPLAIAHARR